MLGHNWKEFPMCFPHVFLWLNPGRSNEVVQEWDHTNIDKHTYVILIWREHWTHKTNSLGGHYYGFLIWLASWRYITSWPTVSSVVSRYYAHAGYYMTQFLLSWVMPTAPWALGGWKKGPGEHGGRTWEGSHFETYELGVCACSPW